MIRARQHVVLVWLSLSAPCIALACGAQQAIDVTRPDDSSSSGDWGEDSDDPETKGEASKPAKVEAWEPCLQKKCGTPCTQCSPADEGCDEIGVLKQCNAQGDCVVAPADCSAAESSEK